VRLGIRPEDLSVTRAGSPDEEISLNGSILDVEPLGSFSLANIKVGDAILKVQEGPYYTANPGENVTAHVSRQRLRLFDGEDGTVIA
jgi:multiple sugar transport system ATP-binding protein